MATFEGTDDPFESDDEWYFDGTTIDLGGGMVVPLSEILEDHAEQALLEGDDTSWPTPDEERRVSQFDTAEEERGER